MMLIRATGFIALGAAVALVLGVIALTIAVITSPPRPRAEFADEPLPPGVHFIDRFRTLDEGRWWLSHRDSNGAYMENSFRRDQLRVTREGLEFNLAATPEGANAPLTSAEIQSRELYQYGYFEFRMRIPRGQGLITGAFTFVLPDEHSSAQEIDIEILGADTRTVELSYHVDGRSVGKALPLGFDAAEDFHNYAFEWGPGVVRWYIDGDMVYEARTPVVARISRPQNIIIHLWGTERLHQWAGRVEPEAGPWRLTLACVAQAESYLGRMLC